MNDVTMFLAITVTVFAAATVLLALMTRLESTLTDQDLDEGPSVGR